MRAIVAPGICWSMGPEYTERPTTGCLLGRAWGADTASALLLSNKSTLPQYHFFMYTFYTLLDLRRKLTIRL